MKIPLLILACVALVSLIAGFAICFLLKSFKEKEIEHRLRLIFLSLRKNIPLTKRCLLLLPDFGLLNSWPPSKQAREALDQIEAAEEDLGDILLEININLLKGSFKK
jgi:hypothetical protein